jgi:hypothetical protein
VLDLPLLKLDFNSSLGVKYMCICLVNMTFLSFLTSLTSSFEAGTSQCGDKVPVLHESIYRSFLPTVVYRIRLDIEYLLE